MFFLRFKGLNILKNIMSFERKIFHYLLKIWYVLACVIIRIQIIVFMTREWVEETCKNLQDILTQDVVEQITVVEVGIKPLTEAWASLSRIETDRNQRFSEPNEY